VSWWRTGARIDGRGFPAIIMNPRRIPGIEFGGLEKFRGNKLNGKLRWAGGGRGKGEKQKGEAWHHYYCVHTIDKMMRYSVLFYHAKLV
jgi:hypothetical protein